MCLGVPGKITEIYQSQGMRMGIVNFGGVERETCLEFVPQAEVGDYVVIHVGFAISQLSEHEAFETIKILREMDRLNEELAAIETKVGTGPNRSEIAYGNETLTVGGQEQGDRA